MAPGGRSAKLSVDVIANTRKAQSDIEGFSSRTAGAFAGVTAAVASFTIDKLVQGATSAASYLWTAADAAAGLSSAVATAGVVLGDGLEKLEGWASNAAEAVGLSRTAAIRAATTFAGYGKAVGKTGNELTDFSTGAVELAADLAAFKDLPVADAIAAMGSAFRGEFDPLERFITGLNATEVAAAYFRKTGEKVNGTLTNQQRIVGVMAAIQEQAADATGAWAREQDQLGSQSQITAAKLEDLKADVGQLVEPLKRAALEGVQVLTDHLGDLVTAYQEGGLEGLFDALRTKWESAWQSITTTVGGWWDDFIIGARELAPKVLAALEALPETVQTFLDENVPKWGAWLESAAAWLGDAYASVIGALPGFLDTVQAWVDENAPKWGDWADSAIGWLKTAAESVGNAVRNFIDRLKAALDESKGEITKKGLELAESLLRGWAEWWIQGGPAKLSLGLLQALWGAVSSIVPAVAGFGQSIASELVGGIIKYVTDKLPESLRGAVTAAIRAAIGSLPGGGIINAITAGVGRSSGGGGAPDAGVAGRGLFARGATTVNVNYHVPVTVPLGVHAGDVGGAIVAALEGWTTRNGPLPANVVGALRGV
jgi:hypothetical protein